MFPKLQTYIAINIENADFEIILGKKTNPDRKKDSSQEGIDEGTRLRTNCDVNSTTVLSVGVLNLVTPKLHNNKLNQSYNLAKKKLTPTAYLSGFSCICDLYQICRPQTNVH